MHSELNIFSAGSTKLAAFPEKLRLWQKNKAISPVALEIQPTEQCNHRCPRCQGQFSLSKTETRSRARSGIHMDLSILESIWENPPAGIIISGNTGEPLLHPKIENLLADLLSKNIPTILITNGEAITDSLAELAVSSCRGIRVSLDAYDAKSFAYSHGQGEDSWNKVLEAISLLVMAKQKRLSKCRIGIGYLTNNITSRGMLAATALARQLCVEYIQFRPYHFMANDVSQELTDCRKLEDAYFRVFASHQKYDRLLCQQRSYRICHGAWFYSVVDARGDFYLCCHHIGRKEARIGSLLENRWNNLISSDRRRNVISRHPTCSCIPLCRLHSQNDELEQIRRRKVRIENIVVPTGVMEHAMFL
jgi:cyclic pyranopterin phosphate synthase